MRKLRIDIKCKLFRLKKLQLFFEQQIIENNIVSENSIDMPSSREERIHEQGIMRTPRYRDDSDAYR